MSSSFYIFLPSNVKGEGNSTSSFTVMLPKKLEFNSQWGVALTDLIYPFSFPNLGTNEDQYIDIKWNDGSNVRLYFPKMTYKSFNELANSLQTILKEGTKRLCQIQENDENSSPRNRRSLIINDEVYEGEGNSSPISEQLARAQRAAQRSWDNAKKLSQKIPDYSVKLNNFLKSLEAGNFREEDQDKLEELKANISEIIKENLENQKKVLQILQAKNDVQRYSNNNSLIEAKRSADTAKKTERLLVDSMNLIKDKFDAAETQYNDLLSSANKASEIAILLKENNETQSTDKAENNIASNVSQNKKIDDESDNKTQLLPIPEALTASNGNKNITQLLPIPKDLTEAEENANKKSAYVPTDVLEQAHKNLFKRLEESKQRKQRKEEDRLMANANIEEERERLRKEGSQILIDCNIVSGTNFENLHNYVIFKYDENQERFRIILNKNFIKSISLSSQLKYLLGMEGDSFSLEINEARYLPDLRAGISTIYIYANQLIMPTIIGDRTAPILRIVTIKGNPGDLVEEHFLNPQYFKLTEKTITQISIDLRTSSGKLVPFNYGDCILCLHFKKL